jgi:hypothetical protein
MPEGRPGPARFFGSLRLARASRRSERIGLGRLAYPFLGLALYLAGILLRGGPANPDVEFSNFQVLGLYLIFGSFFLAVVGWGSLIADRLKIGDGSLARTIALGSMGSSILAMLLGYLRLIPYELAPLAVMWIGGGLVAGAGRWRSLLPERVKPAWSWVPAAICIYYLACWLAKASLAHGTTDPFFYHLLGPRQWTDAGRIFYHTGSPATIHASYWEQLFIWVNLLLGDHEGRGLLEGHLFAQMLHVGLGVVMVSSAVYSFTRAHVAWAGWAWLAVYATMNSSSLAYLANLAKNDYGVAGWGLVGSLMLLMPTGRSPAVRRNELLTGGFLVGAALIAKVVYILSIGPLLLAWVGRDLYLARGKSYRPPLGRILLVAAAAAIPMLAMMTRNFIFTGDPLFPFLTTKFHLPTTLLGPTYLEVFPSMIGHKSTSLAWSGRMIMTLLVQIGWAGLAAFLVFPLAWFLPRLRFPALVFSACLLGYALFASVRFLEFFYRWQAPGLVLQCGVAVIVLATLAEGFARKPRVRIALTAVIMAASLAAIREPTVTDLTMLTEFAERPSQIHVLRNPGVHQGGDSLAWLRLNMVPGDRAVTTGYQLMYYVSHLDVGTIQNEPGIDEALYGLTDPALVVRRLRGFGVRYVVDVFKWDSRYYWPIAWIIDDLASAFPQAIAYQGKDSFVLDLERLAPELERGCLAPRG